MNFEQFFTEEVLKKKRSVLGMRKSKSEMETLKFNKAWDAGMSRYKGKLSPTMSPAAIMAKNKKKSALGENAQILLKGLESLLS